MAFARDTYTASAAQTDFTITFGYLAEEDVYVYKNGTLQTVTTDYTIVASTTVRFVSGLADGDDVVIVRKTSQTVRLVDYTTASTLTEEDLDDDSLQAFYLAQEALDQAALAMQRDSEGEWDAGGSIIQEVGEPEADQDAATKIYVDEVLVTMGNLPVAAEAEDGDVLVVTAEGVVAWAEVAEAYIPDGLIDAGMLAGLTITEAELAAESVIGSKIESGAIDEAHFAEEAVGTDDIQAGIVDEVHIATGAVALSKLDATAGTEGQYLKNEEATSVVWHTATEGDWTYVSPITIVDEISFDIVTGLPTAVTEIEVMFKDLGSDLATAFALLQLGGAGGYSATGYNAAGVTQIDGAQELTATTTGIPATSSAANWTAAETWSGSWRLRRGHTSENTWYCNGECIRDDSIATSQAVGVKALAEALTKLQLITSGGAEPFDAGGVINVRYR